MYCPLPKMLTPVTSPLPKVQWLDCMLLHELMVLLLISFSFISSQSRTHFGLIFSHILTPQLCIHFGLIFKSLFEMESWYFHDDLGHNNNDYEEVYFSGFVFTVIQNGPKRPTYINQQYIHNHYILQLCTNMYMAKKKKKSNKWHLIGITGITCTYWCYRLTKQSQVL